jgi:NADH:ubiquinone oxidoreductase subunit D
LLCFAACLGDVVGADQYARTVMPDVGVFGQEVGVVSAVLRRLQRAEGGLPLLYVLRGHRRREAWLRGGGVAVPVEGDVGDGTLG